MRSSFHQKDQKFGQEEGTECMCNVLNSVGYSIIKNVLHWTAWDTNCMLIAENSLYNTHWFKLELFSDNELTGSIPIENILRDSAFQIHFKRDSMCCFINSYFEDDLMEWQANLDIQPVLDYYKVVSYMWLYLSKSGCESSEEMNQAAQKSNKTVTLVCERIKSVARAYTSSKEKSVQEAILNHSCVRRVLLLYLSIVTCPKKGAGFALVKKK